MTTTSTTRSTRPRNTRHELNGFWMLPMFLACGLLMVDITCPQPTDLKPSLILLFWASAGWVVMYWALMNYMRSNAALLILITCGVAVAFVIVVVVSGSFGLRLPGYQLLANPPAVATQAVG